MNNTGSFNFQIHPLLGHESENTRFENKEWLLR